MAESLLFESEDIFELLWIIQKYIFGNLMDWFFR